MNIIGNINRRNKLENQITLDVETIGLNIHKSEFQLLFIGVMINGKIIQTNNKEEIETLLKNEKLSNSPRKI